MPPEERIATFDQDGTLWVEHPIYSPGDVLLGPGPVVAEKNPKLKNVEPFKTVLSGNPRGNCQSCRKLILKKSSSRR